jgi:glycosyltransferase involved in cell wall biosynthesis
MSPKSKIFLVANTSWYLYNFRLPLARHLRDAGNEVVFLAPQDAYSSRLTAEKFRWIDLPLRRKSVNPLRELLTIAQIAGIYRSERPDVCHHFTIKCVLYGTIAAKLSGVKAVVNSITGLGHAFIGQSLVHRILRPALRFVYRRILTARRVEVIFQNGDDFEEFYGRQMVSPEKTTIIRGSGVCLQRFAPRPGPLDGDPDPVVLLASRLIEEKGIHEYVEAARILKIRGIRANFALAGNTDDGNPSAISATQLQSWIEEGAVDYLGQIDNIEEVLALTTLVVLPSYREGTPRILLEAAAMGKPIVATDVPGCREVVRHGVNGLLVEARDAQGLADAIGELLEDSKRLTEFGIASREISKQFEEGGVIQATVAVYDKARKRTGKPIRSSSPSLEGFSKSDLNGGRIELAEFSTPGEELQ